MKELILFGLICLVSIYSSAQNKSCSDFKIGIFQNVKDGVAKSTITRKKNYQVEEFGEKKVETRVEWIDECTYRLTFVKGNKAWREGRGVNKPIPAELIVRIIEVGDDFYVQEAKFVGDNDFKYKSKIVLIKYE